MIKSIKQRKRPQKVLSQVTKLPMLTEHNFEKCFESALDVTRNFTLSRDVQACIASALKRENRCE